MPSPNTALESSSLTLPTASHLLTQFTTFVTLFVHSLLYHRALYPSASFTAIRAYNLPVHQSRHPGVCQWINDAVAATAEQLREGAVDKIVFSVLQGKGQRTAWKVMERWVVDVSRFPSWGKADADADAELGEAANGEVDGDEDEQQQQQPQLTEGEVNWTDVTEALRGALRRTAYAAEKMDKLPEGCTFTLAVELRDQVQPPIKHPQHWIPSDPNVKTAAEAQNCQQGTELIEDMSPVRSVHAGPLFFECWVEHVKPDPSADQTPPIGAKSATTTSS